MQFYKGQADGTYKLAQTSPLASEVLDMVWGDYDKRGRADLALVRPNSTDVWLNTTNSVPPCGAGQLRTIPVCFFSGSPGIFRFYASPRDNFPINAIQIYVDGTVKFETPDDFLSARLQIPDGTHRITVKAWDDQGPYSGTFNLTSCTNSTNRTVRICTPLNGSTAGSSVRVVASAATNLKFAALQIYLDGVVKFSTMDQLVDFTLSGVSPGMHHITVKGWDSSGAFSSALNVTTQ